MREVAPQLIYLARSLEGHGDFVIHSSRQCRISFLVIKAGGSDAWRRNTNSVLSRWNRPKRDPSGYDSLPYMRNGQKRKQYYATDFESLRRASYLRFIPILKALTYPDEPLMFSPTADRHVISSGIIIDAVFDALRSVILRRPCGDYRITIG